MTARDLSWTNAPEPEKPLGNRLPQHCHGRAPTEHVERCGVERHGFGSIGCSSGISHPLVVASIVRRKKKGVSCDNPTTFDHDRSRNKDDIDNSHCPQRLEAVLTKPVCLSSLVADSVIRGFLPSVGWMITSHHSFNGYSTSE